MLRLSLKRPIKTPTAIAIGAWAPVPASVIATLLDCPIHIAALSSIAVAIMLTGAARFWSETE